MRRWLLLSLLLTTFLRQRSVHSYVAPVVANDTYCNFEVIRQAEGAAGASDVSSSERTVPSEASSVLYSLPAAQRPHRDGPLLLDGRRGVQWFTPEQACTVLSTPPTAVIFVGDSVTRHFMQGMQMLVRADIRRGAMQEDGVPANVTEGCTCDLQFKAKECRQWLLRDTRNASKPQPCPSARVVYIETSNDEDAMRHYQQLAALAAEQARAVVVLGGWGLHNRLLAKPVFKHLIHATWKLVHHHAHVRLLCLGIHALQDNVPEQYRDTFNNKKVREFNALLRRLCKAHGIAFFDTFAVTLNQTSFDGAHYELRVNVLKAQLLLNVIVEQQW